jgi:hypothetical protein
MSPSWGCSLKNGLCYIVRAPSLLGCEMGTMYGLSGCSVEWVVPPRGTYRKHPRNRWLRPAACRHPYGLFAWEIQTLFCYSILGEAPSTASDEREQPGGWRPYAGQHQTRGWLLRQRRSGVGDRSRVHNVFRHTKGNFADGMTNLTRDHGEFLFIPLQSGDFQRLRRPFHCMDGQVCWQECDVYFGW